MVIETLAVIGAGAAAVTAGIGATAFAVNWHRYNQSNWAEVTGNSFLKHCYKKYFQLSQARKKGYAGEYELSFELDKVKGKKKVLYNVVIPSGPNTTTEIDALMIHETGIYVFENKNYSGTIGCYQRGKNNRIVLGNVRADAPKWDIVYNSGKKKGMLNPVLQNEMHVYFVKRMLSCLKIGQQRFFSYITFNNGARIKGAPLDFKISVEGNLLMSGNLSLNLNSKIPQRSAILTPRMMDEICSIFEPYSRVSDEVRKEHIERVQQRVSNDMEPTAEKLNEKSDKAPLNDIIRSAEKKEQAQIVVRDNSKMKNYMNMFRG